MQTVLLDEWSPGRGGGAMAERQGRIARPHFDLRVVAPGEGEFLTMMRGRGASMAAPAAISAESAARMHSQSADQAPARTARLEAVLLAGGKSSRMGRNKAWLPVRGLPLITRQLNKIRKLNPRHLHISAAPGHDYDQLECQILIDIYPDQGPMAGIVTSLRALESDLLLVLAVDMPRMTSRFLSRLVHQCSARRGIVPRLAGQIEPLAAVYPKASLRIAEGLLEGGSSSATRFAQLCAAVGLVTFQDCSERNAALFTNWNYPADVAPLRRRMDESNQLSIQH